MNVANIANKLFSLETRLLELFSSHLCIILETDLWINIHFYAKKTMKRVHD